MPVSISKVTNLEEGIKLFQELFLRMAYNKDDKWVYRKSLVKNNNPRGYHLVGVLAPFIMFYTANYDQFDLNTEQRKKLMTTYGINHFNKTLKKMVIKGR